MYMYVYVKQSDIWKMGSAWKNREEKSGFFFYVPYIIFYFCRFGGNPHQMSFLLEVLTVLPEEVRLILIETCL